MSTYRIFPLPEDEHIYSSLGYKLYLLYKPLYMRLKTPRYLISFPKSGRTWARTFLGKYLAAYHGVPFQARFEAPPFTASIQTIRTYPKIICKHIGSKNNLAPGSTDWRRHIEVFLKKHRHHTKVMIVRDPRDIVVSYYYHLKKRSLNPAVLSLDLPQFLRSETLGLADIIAYMNVWARPVSKGGVAIVRYEDLSASPSEHFSALLRALCIPVDSACLREAISYSSFANMQRREASQEVQEHKLSARDVSDQESFKVRKGKVGGYLTEFSTDDLAYADSLLKTLDDIYGYN